MSLNQSSDVSNDLHACFRSIIVVVQLLANTSYGIWRF